MDTEIINDGVDTTVIGLESGYGYYYRVRSRPISGSNYESDWSVPLRQYTMPRAPSSLPASEVDDYSFVANWHSNGASESYLLDVSSSSDFASSSMIHNDLVVYGLSYRMTGLEPVKNYYYQIRSKSGDLISKYSTIISTKTLLGVPDLLDGVVVGDSVIISWDSVDVVDVSYELEISLASDFSMVLDNVGSLLASDTFYGVGGLSYNTYYYYRVRSVVGANRSLWSIVGGVLTSPSSPVVVVSNVTDRSFVLSWDDVFRSSYYEVDISENAYFESVFSDYSRLRIDELSIDVGGLEPGIRYYYRVRSLNGGSFSGYETGSVQTLSLGFPPNFIITEITKSSYIASWDAVAGVSGYISQIAEDTIVLSDFRELQSTLVFVVVDSLEPGSRYYHRVRSRGTLEVSAYSNWIGVTTLRNDGSGGIPTGIDNALMSVNIYPNPVLNVLHLNGVFMESMEIIDNNGRVSMSSRIDNDSFELDIRHLVPGIYYVRALLENEKAVIHKLLKQ